MRAFCIAVLCLAALFVACDDPASSNGSDNDNQTPQEHVEIAGTWWTDAMDIETGGAGTDGIVMTFDDTSWHCMYLPDSLEATGTIESYDNTANYTIIRVTSDEAYPDGVPCYEKLSWSWSGDDISITGYDIASTAAAAEACETVIWGPSVALTNDTSSVSSHIDIAGTWGCDAIDYETGQAGTDALAMTFTDTNWECAYLADGLEAYGTIESYDNDANCAILYITKDDLASGGIPCYERLCWSTEGDGISLTGYDPASTAQQAAASQSVFWGPTPVFTEGIPPVTEHVEITGTWANHAIDIETGGAGTEGIVMTFGDDSWQCIYLPDSLEAIGTVEIYDNSADYAVVRVTSDEAYPDGVPCYEKLSWSWSGDDISITGYDIASTAAAAESSTTVIWGPTPPFQKQ